MKYVTIFFDFEGKWGMPFKVDYDLEKSVLNILKILKKYNVKAVFNTCGKIIEVYPDIIKKIDKDGHELAFHGYMHEDFDKISVKKLSLLLERTERNLYDLVGKKLFGFRAPFLLGPKFYNKKIYELFRSRGYKWCSNREIRFVEEISVYHRLMNPFHNLKSVIAKGILMIKHNFLFSLLNIKLILLEDIDEILDEKLVINRIKPNLRIFRNIYWLHSLRSPILKSNIFDFPVCSPLDCDLFGYPTPQEESKKEVIDYAYRCLVKNFHSSKNFYNINLHDWLIGTANRYMLLDKIIKYFLCQSQAKIITPKEILKNLE